MPLAPPLLQASRMSVAYDGRDVVHQADLRLDAGMVTALIGPNGSGKSTLLRTIARLQRTRVGRLVLDGETDALAISRRGFAQRVTLLAQHRPTPSGLTVREVVGFGRHPHRTRWTGRDEGGPAAIDRALSRTGANALADRAVDSLSGGQLQRVWIAACLAQQTDVLLLDEPTTYLDLRYQVEVLDLICALADDGIAVGVVLHDLDQAAAIADRVVLLDEGRVVADGTPQQVYDPALLTRVYGIPIEVDDRDGLRTRALGAHHLRLAR